MHDGGDISDVTAEARQAEDAEAARLVTRAQAGDNDAFGTLYSRYYDRVYAYLLLLLRNPHDAEDATQHVFAQAYENLPGYEHRRSFWVWIFTIVRNHAINELKKRNRLEIEDPQTIADRRERPRRGLAAAVVAEPAEPEPLAIDWLTDSDILCFIEHMPLPQRQVLVMRYMLDLANPQIAQVMDRTPTDVGLLHHRAVKFLRKRLANIGRTASNHPESTERSDWTRRTPKAVVARNRRFALDP